MFVKQVLARIVFKTFLKKFCSGGVYMYKCSSSNPESDYLFNLPGSIEAEVELRASIVSELITVWKFTEIIYRPKIISCI